MITEDRLKELMTQLRNMREAGKNDIRDASCAIQAASVGNEWLEQCLLYENDEKIIAEFRFLQRGN